MVYNLFSTPVEEIIAAKNSTPIRAEIIFSSAESLFLQAEAAVRGIGTGNAQALYQEGIRQAMLLWGVSSGDADNFIATEPIALLTGTVDEQLEKIATQKWIASYTDGFEGFSIVRDYGYPSELYNGVTDFTIFGAGDINGKYPTRMRYGNDAINNNGANYAAAVAAQGADVMDTKLWWAK